MLAAGAFGCVHAAQGQVGSSLPADFPVIEDASLGKPVIGFGAPGAPGAVVRTPVIFFARQQ